MPRLAPCHYAEGLVTVSFKNLPIEAIPIALPGGKRPLTDFALQALANQQKCSKSKIDPQRIRVEKYHAPSETAVFSYH
jgi:hypothetical protein